MKISGKEKKVMMNTQVKGNAASGFKNSSNSTNTESIRKGAKSATGRGLAKRSLSLILAFILAFGGVVSGLPDRVVSGGVQEAYADDLKNTVPSDEHYDTGGYVTTYYPGPGGNSSHPGDDRGNSTTHQTTTVRQSQSTTSATTFASGAPLSTIYIDQSKINQSSNDGNPKVYIESDRSNIVYKLLASDPSFAPGIEYNASDATVNYNPKKTGVTGLAQVTPGNPVVMSGPLYELTFKNAAIMPDGSKMHLKVTFSDATIYADERLKSSVFNPAEYDGSVYLSIGANFRYGGTDTRQMASYTSLSIGSPAYYVNETAKQYGSTFSVTGTGHPQNETNGGARRLALGQSINATYQIVNDNGIPVEGTFVLAFAGINIDRDPYGGGNNTAKPLWYINADNPELDFFSESIGINTAGLASDFIYVRSNSNNLDDTNTPVTDPDPKFTKKTYYYPIITETGTGTDKVVKITANQPSSTSMDNASYSTGFITVADSGKGITLTGYGHGSERNGMQTSPFASTQLWYRYTASTGSHGNIQTTSEGNFNGTLSDGGTVLEPSGTWNKGLTWNGSGTPGTGQAATYVVTEGKDVYYTMTPDTGYKIGKIWIGDNWDTDGNVTHYTEIQYNSDAVSKMKKGDTQPVTTAADNSGLLTYKEDGTYVLWLDHAEHHEAVHVEWEPATADILVSKVWNDDDDKDGMRVDAYTNNKIPQFRLEYSLNGGRTWTEATSNTIGRTAAKPATTISKQNVPSGLDEDTTSPDYGKYKDGTYVLNNGQTGSYDASPAADQPAPADLTVLSTVTCAGETVYENTKTSKRYVLENGSYYEVTSIDHPFTWQNLPVYTYDSNGNADRSIMYRVVEVGKDGTEDLDNVAIKDYENAIYYDSQAFELTSEESKSWEGWQIYEDTSGNQYALRGSDEYYDVYDDGTISDSPASSQPDPDTLTPVSSNVYRTADKGIPYQMVDVKNEHNPREYYVNVSKNWNDDGILGATTSDNKNEYARVNLKFVLSGTTTNGIVDLNGPAKGNDLSIIIETTESQTEAQADTNKRIDDYQLFVDGNDEQYAWVKKKEGYDDGYYKVANGTIDYDDSYAPYNDLDLIALGAYRKDINNFGADFDNLPTHDGGKPITYTVTEYFYDDDSQSWMAAGSQDIPWTTTGGQLNEVKDAKNEVEGYKADFVNTPTIEDVYKSLPLTIEKQDRITGNALETAEFTVYRNAASGAKAYDKNDQFDVEGHEIYTTGTTEYVLREDPADNKKYYYTFTKDEGTGLYTYTKASIQPDPSELTVKKQMVEVNEVKTKTNGQATITFLEPGQYYVKETKAPAGYTADPTTYYFVVDKNLKTITLEDAGTDHSTSWWKRLYDLLFNSGYPQNADWTPTEARDGGTLIVKDDPITASILVRKYWEDNNDQDNVRPDDGDTEMPKVVLQWTTSAHTATGLPVYTDGTAEYVHKSDNQYYKVTKEDVTGEYVTAAADPQPDEENIAATSETCENRTVYVNSTDNKKYVYVDGAYHELKKENNNYLIDVTGTVESTPAATQPSESDLMLVMDDEDSWTDTLFFNETTSSYDKRAEAYVTYAGGPVLTGQYNAYTWNNVPAYRDGKPVTYRVFEESPLITDGTYKIKYSHTSQTNEKVFTLINSSGQTITTNNQTVDVTNKHDTRIINLEAYKVWNDDDQTKRQTATLTLYKTVNGARSVVTKVDGSGHTVDDTGTVPTTDETDPVKTWTDLPVYEDGYPITYTIEETSISGYKTVYEIDYTKEDDTSVKEEGSAIPAADVKRTYYKGDTDKTIGGQKVYTDGTNQYVLNDTDGQYYEVDANDQISATSASPQPSAGDLTVAKNDDGDDIPTDKEVGDESTTAAFHIENEETIDIEVEKKWVDGANANVDFELWRTTTAEANLGGSKFVEDIICYKNNDNGNRISIQEYSALPSADKANYTEVKGKDWSTSGYALISDPTQTITKKEYDALTDADKALYQYAANIDGWEKVSDHEFAATLFDITKAEDTKKYTFTDLPRQKVETITDGSNELTVYTDGTIKYVLRKGEGDDKEYYYTYTEDPQGVYTYTKADPQPSNVKLSYLPYFYRVLETPKLVRFAADQTSNTEVTNYNIHASNGIANVEVVKELNGRDWVAKDKFYFQIEPVSATDTTDTTHTISMDDVPIPTRTVLERAVYVNSDGTKRYVLDMDNLYREVDANDVVAGMPTNPQPDASTLTQSGTIDAAIEYPITDVDMDDGKVGAIGRAAAFRPIEYSNETVIPRGHTVEFNYKVYEVYDKLGTSLSDATEGTGTKDGITYARDKNSSTFKPVEHTLKIAVTNDANGKMTTVLYWDGATQTGAVPVYTNVYDASAQVTAHVIKQVQGREIREGDSFYFTITNIAGAPMRNTEDASWTTTDSASHDLANIEHDSGTRVTKGSAAGTFDPQSGNGGEYRATKGDTSTWIKLSDLTKKTSDGKATDVFIYELYENAKDANQKPSAAEKDDLLMDGRLVYLKVVATDNQDGTIDIVKTYHSDAACTPASLIENKVLVSKKNGSIAPAGANVNTAETITVGSKDYNVYEDAAGNRYGYDADEDKYYKLDENDQPAGTAEDPAPTGLTSVKAYEYGPAALFVNTNTIDIPVVKEWVGGPAVEDVNLHLLRKLIPLTAEAGLTYQTAESASGDWETIGQTKIVPRGDFMKADGTPDYDNETTKTAKETYNRKEVPTGASDEEKEAIKAYNKELEGFNLSLPKYVTVDGVTYRAVYKLVEDKTSSAYTTAYRSEKAGEETDKNQIFIDGETLIVTNTVVARNEANIAAVKQLLGRQWLDSDDFGFTLVPDGRGTYDTDGKFRSKDTSDTAKASIPMPGNNGDRESQTTGTGKDTVATTHAKKGNGTNFPIVDPNGGLERLARFGAIEYKLSDLTWVKDHYEGDFFYIMKEVIPEGATQNVDGTYTKDGITYDGTEHKVHVNVVANRDQVLSVQIAYDESTEGDATTGTQFTPVYTNRYDAVGEYAQTIDKYIMGRAWKDTDVFDFRMTPLAGAPFGDADPSEFPHIGTNSDDNRETELEGGHAIHSARGAHVKRLDVSDTTNEIQTLTMPKIKFTFSDLDKIAGDGELTYSDHTTPVPAGMAYGQFVYSFEETNDYLSQVGKQVKDLNIDPDTEYARVTVIDKGDGTLDHYVEIFEDRYCKVPRYVPNTTNTPATNPTFVNQLKRDLSITKAWADTPNSDVTMRLQWSVNGTNWYDVDKATFLTGQDVTKTIAKNATGNALTVTWTGLPAYANIEDATDQTGDDKDMNDKWIYYTIKEDSVDHVITRYSAEPYAVGDSYTNTDKYKELANGTNPFKTENAPTGDTYVNRQYSDIIKQLYVTNWRTETQGTARVGVVKQYIGKVWEDESFTFEMTPVKSKLGGATDYTTYDDQVAARETDPKVKVMPTLADNKATANTGTAPVSVNEHAANFNPLTIKLGDLVVDPDDGKEKGEFIYEIKEVIPDGAVAMTEGGKTYYVAKDEHGNIIKYTTDTHTVKVLAVDDGSGKIAVTVSYDERNTGEFVPVYTNYAMTPTPIEGTKTWVGGPASEHVNGTVELDANNNITEATDSLGLQLKRILAKEGATEETLTKDDAGRDLAVVWVKEIPAKDAAPTGYWINSETSEKIDDATYQQITDEEEKAKYTQEMSPATPASVEKQEGGDGNGPYTYTIMAKDEDDKYVDPFLNATDAEGYTYDYYIKESRVPNNYEAKEEGLHVTNTNTEKVNVPVTKEWVDGPAVEDVTLHLMRMLIPISDIEATTDPVDLSYGNLETLATQYNSWKKVGLVHTAPRGEFVKNDGTPKYDDGSTNTASQTYGDLKDKDGTDLTVADFIAGFNKDLPLYVTENKVDYRAIYKLVEDDSSDAYVDTYKTVNSGEEKSSTGAYYLNPGDTLIVTNTVEATNEANIAAVKQLLGREWSNGDDFAFTLEPAGKGTYKEDGSFDDIDPSDAAKASVPMPKDDTGRESTTSVIGYVSKTDSTEKKTVEEYNALSDDEKKAYVAQSESETHARKGDGSGNDFPVVDPNGNLERLARFGAIEFDVNDLVYDKTDGHMQGDFFYVMKEVVPADAKNASGKTYSEATPEEKAVGGFSKDGITYDSTEHTVHVKVRENRTGKLQVQVAYDETTDGDITTGTQFTPVYTNKMDDLQGKVQLTATKYLDGRSFKGGDTFSFMVTPTNTLGTVGASNTPMPENAVMEIKPTSGTNATVDFGKITYSINDLEAKEITYAQANDGQKAAARYWTVKTTETDSQTQQQVEKITVYDLKDTAKKTEWDELGDIVKNTATTTLRENTFTYIITENPKDSAGGDTKPIKNDAAIKRVTVNVLYDELNHKILVSARDANGKYITGENATDATDGIALVPVSFTNEYDSSASWMPEATKVLDGRPLERDQFEFKLDSVAQQPELSEDDPEGIWVIAQPPTRGDQYVAGADNTLQDVDAAGTAATKGTNDLVGSIDFEGVDYTNELLQRKVKYGKADPTTLRHKVISWELGSTVYGPIPDDAQATVTVDGTEKTVTFAEATDAQRRAAKGSTAGSEWQKKGKTYISLTTDPTQANMYFYYNAAGELREVPEEAQGIYYADSREMLYKMWEVPGSQGGYTYDEHNSLANGYEVKVTIAEQKDGTLKVTSDKTKTDLVFTNEYEATGDVTITGLKVMDNDRAQEAGEFTFTITPVTSNAPTPTGGTLTNAADGTIDFGKLTFTQEHLKAASATPGSYDAIRTKDGFYQKTFVYNLKESADSNVGITYDGATIKLAITVQEDNAGKIKVVAVNGVPQAGGNVVLGTAPHEKLAFTNEYQASGTATIAATKELVGKTLKDNMFFFELSNPSNTAHPVVDEQPNKANGSVTFSPIVYNLAQVKADAAAGICAYTAAAGTEPEKWVYTYNIKELVPADETKADGFFYDTTVHTVTVTIKDNKDGTLTATVDKAASGVKFTNKAETIEIEVKKTWNDDDLQALVGKGYDRPKSVSIKLTDSKGTTHPNVALSDSNSWTYTFKDLPAKTIAGEAIEYTVTEVDVPYGYTVTYKVNNGTAGATATVDSVADVTNEKASVEIINTPTVSDLLEADLVLHKIDSVTNKNIAGVTFELSGPGITGSEEYVTDAHGVLHLSFAKDFEGAGKQETYTYKLKEKAPATGYKANGDEYELTVQKSGDKMVVDKVELKTPGKNAFEQLYDLIVGNKKNADYDEATRILTVKNTPNTNKVTITKTFEDNKGNAIPDSLLGSFAIEANYTGVNTDGSADPQTKTLKVTGGDITPTASDDGKTYTWEITGVAYNTDVHVHETNYISITGYDFVSTAVTANVNGATTHTDDASFTIPNNDTAKVEFTNTYKVQTGNLELVKNWDDQGNRDGKRPANVTFTVTATADGAGANVFVSGDTTANTKVVTLTGAADAASWSDASLTKLPLYYNGKQITYKVDEADVAEYDKTVEQASGVTLIKDATSELSIKNAYTPKKGSVKITKTWDDDNNKAGLRAEAEAYLYADGTLVGEITEGTVTTTGGDVITWDNLPIYTVDGTDGSTKIKYTVKETAVPGYITSFEPEGVVELVENATEPSTIAITNKHVPETGELTIKKVWDDNDDQDGFRADSINVTLFAKTIDGQEAKVFIENEAETSSTSINLDASVNWQYQFTGDNKLATTYDGKAVVYYVDGDTETFVGGDKSKYTYTFVERTGDTEITITNIHKPEEGCIEVLKVWDDNNNQDGKRKDAVMTLKATTGTGDAANTDVVGSKTIKANINEPQEAVWHNLPVYRDGEKITYTVEETAIPGYTTEYSDGVKLSGNNDTKTLTVTNKRAAETTKLSVTKEWSDGNNQDGKRTDVILHLKGTINGSDFSSMSFEDKTIAVNKTAADNSDAGTAVWTNLPVYHDGKKITYVVTEEAVPGYTATVSGVVTEPQSGEMTAKVLNERTPAITEVTVTKVWDDANNQDKTRTDVKITLKANGEAVTQDANGKEITNPVTLATGTNHDAEMSFTWRNLPDYSNGQQIDYTVEETQVPGYTPSTTGDAVKGFTVTNTHKPDTTEVSVTKVWEDNNNTDRLRPNSIKAVLYADGTPVAIKTITSPGNDESESTVKFTNLQKNRTGSVNEAIEYTVKEETVPAGYTSEVEGDQHDGYTITNTRSTDVTNIVVTKVWDDNNNSDGRRPSTINVKVKNNDSKNPIDETLTLNAENNWTATLANQRIYKIGSATEKVTYTIYGEAAGEDELDCYTITYSDPITLEDAKNGELTVTNKIKTKEESKTLTFTVLKVDESDNTKVLKDAKFKVVAPNGEETVQKTNDKGKLEITLDQVGTYTVVETAPPADYKLGDVYSWTVKTDKNLENIDKVTEGEESFWKKTFGMIFAKEPEGYDKATATLTVENPPVETKTIKYVDPNPEDPTDTETVLESEIKEGEKDPAQPADPKREGYRFTGWKKTVDPETGDETYTATWEKIGEHTVKYVDPSKPEGEQTVQETTVKEGEKEPGQPADPTRDDYRFTGWKKTVDPETGDISYEAQWEKIGEHTVKYVDPSKPEGEQTVQETTVKEGEKEPGQPADPEREGYRFTGWKKVVDPETGDVGYEATWEQIGERTIKYVDPSKPEGEQTVLEKTIQDDGEEPKQPEDPKRDGYTFGGWDKEIDSDGNETYKARWIENPPEEEPEKIIVTYKNADGTTITAKEIVRGEDEPEQLADQEEDGKIFTGWRRTTDENGNVTYTATFIDAPAPCPEKTTVTVIKAWSDGEDADGMRPDHVTVRLLMDGNVYRTAALTVEGKWTYTFDNLPLYVAGTETKVVYTVEEAEMKGYSAGYSGEGTNDNPLVVTNTRTPADRLTLKATKVWEGENDDESARKDVTFRLVKVVEGEGTIIMPKEWDKTISKDAKDEDLVAVWSDLPSIENGKKVTYTVEEVAVDGYTKAMSDGKVEGNTISVTVTNTKIPVPEPETKVIKYVDKSKPEGEQVIISEQINKGENEPAQPADPERDGYIFGGWERKVDPETGDVTYEAKWTPKEKPGSINVKYVDGEGNELQSDDITKGDAEPSAPEDPTKPGFEFGGWIRSTDPETGDVTYTARWIEIPGLTPKVTYLDPKAEDGKMILFAKEYDGQEAADSEANPEGGQKDAPEDPTHEGYEFVGWVMNQDEYGDWVMVAKYNEVKPNNTIVVSYVDGQDESGNPILKSEVFEVDAEGNVIDQERLNAMKPENDPSHEGLQFEGWVVDEDTNGNLIYTAKYSSDCRNTPSKNWVRYIDSDGSTIYMEKTYVEKDGEIPELGFDPEKEGYKFKGWDKTVDGDGNITFIATWDPIIPDTPGEDPKPAPPTPTPPEDTGTKAPLTGDDSNPYIWMGLMTGSGLIALIYSRKRRANKNSAA